MKKIIISAAAFAAALAALRRFAPAIHHSAMNKCHQMMSKCGEMFGQQAGFPADTACMSTTASGSEQATAGKPEPAQATTAA